MRPTASNTALLDLVAELAVTTPEDVSAVLAMLTPASAAKLRSLLRAYADVDATARPETAPTPVSGLSDWLAARVLGKTSDGTGEVYMTPAAISALRTLAASMPSQFSRPDQPFSRDDGLGWLFRRTSGPRLKA